jgi:hypothetical protein
MKLSPFQLNGNNLSIVIGQFFRSDSSEKLKEIIIANWALYYVASSKIPLTLQSDVNTNIFF